MDATNDTKSGVPLNLLGLVARWRSGDLRDNSLPGVPWTAGEVADALAPLVRVHESTSTAIAALAAQGLSHPESLNLDEVKAICASALTQRESKR